MGVEPPRSRRGRAHRPRALPQGRGQDRDRSVEIPALTDGESEAFGTAKKTEAPVTSADAGATRRIVGYAVGGLGVAAIAVGGAFGIRAIAKSRDSDDLCGDPCASALGLK